MKVRCLAVTAPDRIELAQTELRDPGEREVIIEVTHSCTSPGTELRVMGSGPGGSSSHPYVPGYAMVGRVLRAGPLAGFAEGARVFVSGSQEVGPGLRRTWGGHMSHALTPVDRVVPVPDSVDDLSALLTKLGAIAYHGMRLSRPLAGERVAVVGLGVLGQLSARLHALSGARVVGCDRSAARVEVASGHGFDAIVAGDSLVESVLPHLPGGADIIVDVTGVPAAMPLAIALGRELPFDGIPIAGPRYVVQGSYESNFTVPYGPAFMKELTILVTRDTQHRDQVAVMELLARGALRVRDLISDVRSPEQAPQTYDELRGRATRLLCVAFRWH